MTAAAAAPRRLRLPLVCDLVVVSDPEQIRSVERSGDVDRLHRYPTRELPWWVRSFFRATKFHDDERDLWFCPMEPVSEPGYAARRAYLEEKARLGYAPADVEAIADLLEAGAPDDTLAHAMVQVVNRRFFGREVPREVTEAAKHTLQDLAAALVPWRYRRGVEAQRRIMAYCEESLPAGTHLLDVGHNVGEVVQATAGALRRVAAHPDTPIEALFTAHAPTPQVLRIAVRDTTLGGLLRKPLRAGWTVILLKIGKAAARTGDLRFTFGTGSPERACVFEGFFLSFMRDLQSTLRTRREPAAAERHRPAAS